jgi:hypothetical protein
LLTFGIINAYINSPPTALISDVLAALIVKSILAQEVNVGATAQVNNPRPRTDGINVFISFFIRQILYQFKVLTHIKTTSLKANGFCCY